ncbi:Histidine kinase [uncultured Desulfobacterium sp.]|uniref:histidine kinase n=1 Tax=uncultured Desulfobacterium sp. TaxID=201089 RepID=A0A445MT60_9BACT|nr:Histidine kinase [uncultured Desulfobacterium sp.]
MVRGLQFGRLNVSWLMDATKGTTSLRKEKSDSPPSSSASPFVTEEEKGRAYLNIPQGERPSISIRTRLILAFSLIFALCAGVTLWSIYFVSTVQAKIHFLETSGNYRAEIQEARRYEKNYLLYGTDLPNAITHLRNAEQILNENTRTIQRIIGADALRIMTSHIAEYHRQISRLTGSTSNEEKSIIETKLREHGGQMVDLALDFEIKEKESMEKMLVLARRIPFLFLGLLLGCIVLIVSFLVRQLLGSFARFMAYTKRIGEGNFTPIIPQKKYRDEFSELAQAFNRMIHELDQRYKILVESHKLRAVGTLVAGVAHELNNPLNNTMLTATMLQEDYPDLSDEEKLDMIQDVIKETERSQKIVRNLLDFAREGEAQVTPLNLDEILNSAIRLVANQVRLAKINLVSDLEAGLPPIHGDAQMLQQVFINLILNAVDVLPEKGIIKVSTGRSRDDAYVVVRVKDNGPGIPEHILSRIFEPFFTTKAKGKGTGLGLSVSSGIIHKLGGYIQAESKSGEGTTFSVFLPTTNIPSHISSGEAK